jgi:hypothetical protein
MAKVAVGYIVEQVIICTVLGIASLSFSAWQVYNQRLPQNHTLVRPLHRRFNRALLIIAIVELMWGVDPRGVWDIYPPELIAACKDFITSSFMCLGVVWMDAHIRIMAESLGKVQVQVVSEAVTIGIPVCGTYLTAVVLLLCSTFTQSDNYRAYFIYFLHALIFCECIAVTVCLAYIMRIRKLAMHHISSGSEHLRKMKRLVINCIILWIVFLGTFYASFYAAGQTGSLRASQIPTNKSKYSFYNFLLFHFLGFVFAFEAGRFQGVKQESHVTVNSRQASRSVIVGVELKEQQDQKNRTSSI